MENLRLVQIYSQNPPSVEHSIPERFGGRICSHWNISDSADLSSMGRPVRALRYVPQPICRILRKYMVCHGRARDISSKSEKNCLCPRSFDIAYQMLSGTYQNKVKNSYWCTSNNLMFNIDTIEMMARLSLNSPRESLHQLQYFSPSILGQIFHLQMLS